MDNKHRLRVWGAGLLALAGGVTLTVWMFSLYNYGIWVDENSAEGEGRPIDYILFVSGLLLLAASVAVLFVRRKVRS